MYFTSLLCLLVCVGDLLNELLVQTLQMDGAGCPLSGMCITFIVLADLETVRHRTKPH